jgi:hypothetical protein
MVFSFWCAWQESDLRPSGPQPDALSTELQARVRSKKKARFLLLAERALSISKRYKRILTVRGEYERLVSRRDTSAFTHLGEQQRELGSRCDEGGVSPS